MSVRVEVAVGAVDAEERDYMIISMPSERVFSTAGDTVTYLQTCRFSATIGGMDGTWTECKVRCILCQIDNEFVFKIRALHCTPLEFRTGFLAGGF